jgi:hypothetical protein
MDRARIRWPSDTPEALAASSPTLCAWQGVSDGAKPYKVADSLVDALMVIKDPAHQLFQFADIFGRMIGDNAILQMIA